MAPTTAHTRLPSPHPRTERRVRIGLTQEQLAEDIGCHVNSLARWEAGEHVPRTDLAEAWEDALAARERTMLDYLANLHPEEAA